MRLKRRKKKGEGGKEGGREGVRAAQENKQIHSMQCIFAPYQTTHLTPKKGFTSQNPLCTFAVVWVYQRKQKRERKNVSLAS